MAPNRARRLRSEHGLVLVLLLLAIYFSASTVSNFDVEGEAAVEQVVGQLQSKDVLLGQGMIAVGETANDHRFATSVKDRLDRSSLKVTETIVGGLRKPVAHCENLAVLGGNLRSSWPARRRRRWEVLDKETASWAKSFPSLANVVIVSPQPYRWPQFLTRRNLLQRADQIAVIAIIAIGMTLVIITGGIDLSVGSLTRCPPS